MIPSEITTPPVKSLSAASAAWALVIPSGGHKTILSAFKMEKIPSRITLTILFPVVITRLINIVTILLKNPLIAPSLKAFIASFQRAATLVATRSRRSRSASKKVWFFKLSLKPL